MGIRTSVLLGSAFLGATLTVMAPVAISAQEPAVPAPPLEIGVEAPDFALPGATRFGVLAEPVRLRDYRGEVVVLAFFFRARTKG